MFLRKSMTFQGLDFFFKFIDFSRFQGPVGTMFETKTNAKIARLHYRNRPRTGY